MYNFALRGINALPRLPGVPVFAGLTGLLALCYIALIAVVMSYAALQIEFAQQVRSDEAQVATLEASYLNSLSSITSTNYLAEGYNTPVAKVFVKGAAQTALNTH